MRWECFRSQVTVFCLKYHFNIFWGQFSPPDVKERPHHDADHVAKITICDDLEKKMVPLVAKLGRKDQANRVIN